MFRRRDRENGFSIVELAVVLSVLLIILALAGDFVITAMNEQNISLTRDQLSRQTRFSLDDLVNDLRDANSGDPTIDPITNLASTSFTMYTPNRATPYHMQKVAYQLSGTNLQRSITTSTNTAVPWTFPGSPGAWVTVIPNVQTLTFTYRDATGAVTSATSKVQRVDINLTIDNDPHHSPWTQTYSLSVDLRITNA